MSRQSVSKVRKMRNEHSNLYGKSSGRALSRQQPECGEGPGRSQCGKEKEVRSKKSAGIERGPVATVKCVALLLWRCTPSSN